MTSTLDLSLQFGKFVGDTLHRKIVTRAWVKRWVGHALARPGEITVRIVGEAEGRALNLQYRSKDYATNVLSFGYGEGGRNGMLEGDIVLCVPVLHTVVGLVFAWAMDRWNRPDLRGLHCTEQARQLSAGGQVVRSTILIQAALAGIENLTDKDYRIHGSGQNEPGLGFVLGAKVLW